MKKIRITRDHLRKRVRKMLLEAQYTTQLSAPDQLHAPTQKQYAKKVFELIDNNDIYKIVGSVARNSNSKQYNGQINFTI